MEEGARGGRHDPHHDVGIDRRQSYFLSDFFFWGGERHDNFDASTIFAPYWDEDCFLGEKEARRRADVEWRSVWEEEGRGNNESFLLI